MDHHWETGHLAWADGWHDGWIAAKTRKTMGYYDRDGVALYRELAETFTLCDAYHCSVLSETTSNRNYFFSGYTGFEPHSDSRAISGQAHGRENREEGYDWTSYPELLQRSGKTWKVYQEWDNYYDNNLEFFSTFKAVFRKALKKAGLGYESLDSFYESLTVLAEHNSTEARKQMDCLAAGVAQLEEPERQLYARGLRRVAPRRSTRNAIVRELRADIEVGALPQVSYLVPARRYSEHPDDSSPRSGENLVYQVLDALASSPGIWDTTVLLIGYDENDGYFDHVPPPIPPDRFQDEFVHGAPIGMGFRVPLLVVSPWSVGGYVCSQTFDHTSQTRFLEEWLKVRQPQISEWRRIVAGDLTSAFDFDRKGPLPRIAPGTRRARPLPYQPDAYYAPDPDSGRHVLTLANAGPASAHMTLYPYAHQYEKPQHFEVATGHDQVVYVPNASTTYRFTVTGPNGFRREFKGPLSGPAAGLAITSSISRDPRCLHLTAHNRSQSDFTLIVQPQAPDTSPPQTHTLKPRTTTQIMWDTTPGHGWYDLTLHVTEVASFERRLTGHIENGQESVTYTPAPVSASRPQQAPSIQFIR
jgi:phospholipase C